MANEISTIMNQANTTKISVIIKEQLDDLPYPVANWLNMSGMVGKEKINAIWLSQKAMMKMKPGQKEWNEADAQRYEWVITVKKHSIENGIKIPTKMEVTWRLENGNWTWLDLEITDIRYNM